MQHYSDESQASSPSAEETPSDVTAEEPSATAEQTQSVGETEPEVVIGDVEEEDDGTVVIEL